MTEELPSWRDGPAKQAIMNFVARTCGEDGSTAVPPEERVAVFDNDGTLWCEKPMPIQLDFILRRIAEMTAVQPELADQQPWKAVSERRRPLLAAGNSNRVRHAGIHPPPQPTYPTAAPPA